MDCFDNLFQDETLGLLKLLLPCLSPDLRGGLAVYIKFSELALAISLAGSIPNCKLAELTPLAGDSLFDTILGLCSEDQKAQIQEFRQMTEQFDSIRQMMEMAELMQ